MIPELCPSCKAREEWQEVINPFTTGIPIGGSVRFSLISNRGLFATPIKKRLGFYNVKYRCEKCGYEDNYDLYDQPNRLPDRHL